MGLRKDSPKIQKEPDRINIGQARYRLIGGPYKAPRVKIGQIMECAVRGDVRIVGMTDASIPWPIGQTKRAKSLVISGSC